MARVSLIAHQHRPGGGFRWSIDTDDRHVQLGPVLVSRCRQPEGAPLFDPASTTQRHEVADGKGWSIDWTGWAIRPLRVAVTFQEGSRLGRLAWRVQMAARMRATRRRERRYRRGPSVEGTEAQEPDARPPTGYVEGPTLAEYERPWPVGWEQQPGIDSCSHLWERVTILDWRVTATPSPERVVRCAVCHVPRCGASTDPDPCMARRHHQGDHLPLSDVLGYR